jgi:type I restriction-modification system DNA methylase subunit
MATNLSDMTITDQLKAYGAPIPLYLNRGESASLINYLDLVKNREKKLIPEAVIEYQSRPILYIVNNNRLSNNPRSRRQELFSMKSTLANRGEAAYIAILRPGQLEVYPINLKKDLGGKIQVFENDVNSHTFFQALALGTSKLKKQSNPDYIYDRIFSLLQKSSNHLISKPCNLPKSDVLSLVGRALFFRFLKDRDIIIESDLLEICPGAKQFEECFANPKNAAATSAWLDITFNGDLLPLPSNGDEKYFHRINEQTKGDVFLHLSAIVFGAEPSGLGYQLHLWKDFDFSHIPVGLLSQVYESFSTKWDPYSKSTSIHYTPRNIAEYLIDESFASISNASKARVLDPAVGAGIFLVIAFKRLVAENWKREGVRPNSKKIQEILYQQLSGFDINESALKLASLSLYLTAIELDAHPRPPKKMRFPCPLREKVLFYVRKPTDPVDGPILGSLGFDSDALHKNKYDLVVGNPPWTKLGKEHSVLANQYTKIIRQIARNRGLEDIANNYSNPDRNPDLPFLWKAMEWSKPGGIIAFTLPSRILFKQSPPGKKAREALFKAVKVTGLLNYSCLRKTKVWPKMNHPFCLLFAKNTLPEKDSEFYIVSPRLDSKLNSKGRARIDYASAEPIQSSKLIKEPWLLKTLTVGTPLDVAILRKIITNTKTTIKDYWEEKELKHSRGYEINEKEKPFSALKMKNFPNLNNETAKHISFYLDPGELPSFKLQSLWRPRDINIYQPPLMLLRKSPRENINDGRTLLCLNKVAYHEIFYGYSGCGHPHAEELIRYLYLISYSRLFKYYILTTSPKFGVDRPVFHKVDFDHFPFIPLEEIKSQDRMKIWDLSNKLAHDDKKPFDKIDQFICGIYGLNSSDIEVINDTIDVGLPFKNSRKIAETTPSRKQIATYIKYLTSQLSPFFKVVGQTIQAENIFLNSIEFDQPWHFIELSTQTKGPQKDFTIALTGLMEIANAQGASQIIIKGREGLLIGILNQYRYWTKSRARLCGLDILRNHMDSFVLPGNF